MYLRVDVNWLLTGSSWGNETGLTDALLAYIESHDTTRIALKFFRGEGGGGTGSGGAGSESQKKHHSKIAASILLTHSSGDWNGFKPEELSGIIKNRIAR
jgi:hypothetical protein